VTDFHNSFTSQIRGIGYSKKNITYNIAKGPVTS